MEYLNNLTDQLGVSLWLFIVILIWSIVWKLLALWKSAKKNHVAWFIVIALVNSVGILPILYIYIFSDINYKKKKVKKASVSTKSVRKKK